MGPTRINANLLSWAPDIEPQALEQAERSSRLPFVHGHVALMPDAHWGMGATIGSVIPTKGAIIPAAVGVDIGCGMLATRLCDENGPLTSASLPDDLAGLHQLIAAAVPAGVGQGHQDPKDLPPAPPTAAWAHHGEGLLLNAAKRRCGMTERPLTITAAEWASRKDGRLWLAREGNDWTSGGGHLLSMSTPPAEFVQACAPCETCDDTQDHPVLFDGERLHVPACPDCRIELVGPMLVESTIPEADAWRTVTLGHAYAVGQPLPIKRQRETHCDPYDLICVTPSWATDMRNGDDLTAALAHCGDPVSLVGKWAIELTVTP